ncbi:MAG: proprotein convertase P-domain-containing protein, partial [Phycisphaerales bacterium]|nr:proprotein convertase P-domain-containing protein [Phycisphaerales bacterium]
MRVPGLWAVAAAAAAACACAAFGGTTIEITGRATGGGFSTGPWVGVRAGEFVHMSFNLVDNSGFVLTTYPTGDIRGFELDGPSFRQTVRGQVLGIKKPSQFNPVINVSNNAPVADGFYIFGAGGGAFQLIPVGAPSSTPATYIQVLELHEETGTMFSTSDLPLIPGVYQGSQFSYPEWSIAGSVGVAISNFIIRDSAEATGACCAGDGFCAVTSQGACPGAWTMGGACSSATGGCAPVGACCTATGGCSLLESAVCNAITNAVFLGDNSACTAGACPPVGACCNSGSCSMVTQAACDSFEGSWLGQYVTCAILPEFATYYQHTPPQPGDALLPINDAQFISGNPGTHIPRTTTSTVTITDTRTIQTLEVWVGMYHQRVADVKLELTGPNGTTVELLNRFGTINNCATMPVGPQRSMDGNFIFQDSAALSINEYMSSLAVSEQARGGRYRPSSCGGGTVSLDAPSPAGFGGIPVAGTWTLTITDSLSGAGGNLGVFGISINGGNPEPCTLGACCTAQGCAIRGFSECPAGEWLAGGSCNPDPCLPATGACCCGSSCTVTTAAQCSGANSAFGGAGTACTPFSLTSPCC